MQHGRGKVTSSVRYESATRHVRGYTLHSGRTRHRKYDSRPKSGPLFLFPFSTSTSSLFYCVRLSIFVHLSPCPPPPSLSQRANLAELLVSALADGAHRAPSRLPSAKAACVAALSAALRRLHTRCCGPPSAASSKDDTAVVVARLGEVSSSLSSSSSSSAAAAAAATTPTTRPTATATASVLAGGGVGGGGGGGGGGGAPATAGVTSGAFQAPAARADAGTGFPTPSSCREARARKRALAVGATAFLAKPREGLKLLQVEGIFRRKQQQQQQQQRLDAAEVAEFLRSTPGLDKAAVGAYLGEAGAKNGGSDSGGGDVGVRDGERRVAAAVGGEGARDRGGGGGGGGGRGRGVYQGDTAEFHAEVLEAFVETFDFRDQGLLASLRMFLESFRLPGEAQQIDRILHVSHCQAVRDQ